MKLLRTYHQATKLTNRSFLALLVEAVQLRFSQSRLGLTEYIDFQLYKDDLPRATKALFGGQRQQFRIEEMLVDDYSKFLSLDKVTMYTLLSGFGLPIPTMKATYRSLRPSRVAQLQTSQDLVDYLTDSKNTPAYLKRSSGSYGRGNTLVESAAGTDLVLGSGRRESALDFCGSLDDARSLGWIIQEPLRPHADIQALTNSEKISGLRLHTFLCKDTVKITKAIFKINAGIRDSDNFEHGASGNMLGAVDVQTGRVFRAVAGVGLHQIEIPVHPKTLQAIVGFKIPHWRAVVDLVTEAQKAFPGFICPGWDIAICPDGPKILEVNAFGDIDLSQHAHREPFVDEEFLNLLKDRSLDPLMFSSSQDQKRSAKTGRLGTNKHHWGW